jgi:hypothetical protein
MSEIEYISTGSYIIVEACETSEETVKGKVVFSNLYKTQYQKGTIVFYHKTDSKCICIDGNPYDAVNWYNILLIKKVESETEEQFNKFLADF